MQGGSDMAGTLEYEQLNKNLEVVDGHAVKAPEDYQDPEQLYQAPGPGTAVSGAGGKSEKVPSFNGYFDDREGIQDRERSA